ncbi:hypothetical protein [Exiguobacterium mexicanum]|uniref:hypothetical protein n=1 Tax=Exiguobacterium mexicanum TaxID=340146 RepID=UPI00384B6191
MWTETWLFTKRSLVTTIRKSVLVHPELDHLCLLLTGLHERTVECRFASSV